MKIVCIGNASYDITMPVSQYPEENTKIRVPEMVECGGGATSNAAYLLGSWGCDVNFIGVVGNDSHGNWIKKELESVRVRTTFLETNDRFKTPVAYVIANQKAGTRTVLTYRETIQMKKVTLDFTPDLILSDGQEYAMTKKMFKQYPKALKIMDAERAEKEIIELCKSSDYVICSKNFAEEVSKMRFDFNRVETIRDLFLFLKKMFPGQIIVTLEEKGCLYEVDGIIKIMPSIQVTPVDSTGAGDIFHGAFVYGLSKGFSLEKNLKISNVAGALSTQKIGGRFSVPAKESIRKIIHDFE